MKTVLIFVTVVTLLPNIAFAADHRKDAETDEFALPSGNIMCVHGATDDYTGIYCLRSKPKLVSVRFLDGVVESQEAEGDQPFMDQPPVLAYGATREYKDMTCSASKKGIQCMSGKKGFLLSRNGLKTFK